MKIWATGFGDLWNDRERCGFASASSVHWHCATVVHPLWPTLHSDLPSTVQLVQLTQTVHIFYKIDVRAFCYWVICPTPPTGGIPAVQFDRAPSWTSPTHPSFPVWPPSACSSHSCASLRISYLSDGMNIRICFFIPRALESVLKTNIGICFCIYMPRTSVSFDWHGCTPAQLMHCICEHRCLTVSIQTSVHPSPIGCAFSGVW